MRTAVLFFGEIRGYPDLWKHIYKYIVEPNNADVFMHHFCDEANFLDSFQDAEIKKIVTNYYLNKGLNLFANPQLADIFSPKTLNFEKRRDFVAGKSEKLDKLFKLLNKNFDRKFLEHDYNAIMNQQYSRKRVIDLKLDYENENNFVYDNVIITRLDINIHKPLIFEKRLDAILAKNLCRDFSVFDQIISGPSPLINNIGTFFYTATDLYLRHCNSNTHFYANERFVYLHLKNMGIQTQNFDYPLDYTHSRNGICRFNKAFILPNDETPTFQIFNNVDCILKDIAKKVVPKNLTLGQIKDIPDNYGTIKIQILNNKIYTSNIVTDKRGIQILNQLYNVTQYHQLPNVIFAYNTMDQYSYLNWNDPIFTHSKIYNDKQCNHILAPDFSFDESLINITTDNKSYLSSEEEWYKKHDIFAFMGTLYKDRKINTQFPPIENIETNIIEKSTLDEKCADMSELINYKYLLHLNGYGGSRSTNLKYLMLTGSLIFYMLNYNAVEENITPLSYINEMKKYVFQKTDEYDIYCLYNVEYWMLCDNFQDFLILCRDVKECTDKLEYYSKHKEEAYIIAKRGQKYTSEILSKKNVLLYWKILLETYHSCFEESMDELIYFIPFERESK